MIEQWIPLPLWIATYSFRLRAIVFENGCANNDAFVANIGSGIIARG